MVEQHTSTLNTLEIEVGGEVEFKASLDYREAVLK